MFKNLIIVPKWVVFVVDLLICYFTFLFSHFVKNNLSFRGVDLHTISGNIIVLLIAFALIFFSFRTYEGIIRYTGLQDALKIVYSVLVTTALLFFLSLLGTFFGVAVYFSAVILVLNMIFASLFLILYRMVIKFSFAYLQYHKLDRKNVIIYGADDAAFATKRVLEHDYSSNVNIVAFLDDDNRKVNKVVDGIRIWHTRELEQVALAQHIDEIILADFSLNPIRKNVIVDFCLDHNIKILNVPPVDTWINGQFSSRQLQSIKIENLLEREAIKLSNKELASQITNKKILVTGAAGSIGSELVRQLLKYEPDIIILCDQAETPLHHLELELATINKSKTKCIPFLCDVANKLRVSELFEKFQPDYVYHVAAYKHVPMMEFSAPEAILNNVVGTKILADLSINHNVKRFVLVSTDKAVNPTNVMGASKRLAEIYVQFLHNKTLSTDQSNNNFISPEDKFTRFIITRFGNVLGTSGSVVSIFQEQINKGGPVTVTHPDITRYFMTIPESCQLVLEAGSMGKGGEIFVFDMGEPVTIVELAKKMIRLYGLIPGSDIEIKYSGLRPGEKLYEELWTENENLLPTHHEKIMIAKTTQLSSSKFEELFENLIMLAIENVNEMTLVREMKKLVPEFISNNSIFEKLD